jgi:peroxiredoxin
MEGGIIAAMDPLLPCRQAAPHFSLLDLNNDLHRLGDYQGRIIVLNFWSAECPWVERTDREITARLPELDNAVVLLTIASNPNEPIELLRTVSRERQLPIVLHDPEQLVADLYGAQTTPHMFVIDRNGVLRYQGAFDDVTFRKRNPSVNYLDRAINALLSGGTPDPEATPPYGCAIVRFA